MHDIKNVITDMDGVLIKGTQLIPGADAFVARLEELGLEYLVLTNNSVYTPRDLSHRLFSMGLSIAPERLFTSAMAAAACCCAFFISTNNNSRNWWLAPGCVASARCVVALRRWK